MPWRFFTSLFDGFSPVGSLSLVQGSGSPSVVTVSNEPGRMWVDKYKPQTTADVIGHGAQVKKLRTWLQNWEAWHLKSNGPTPPKVPRS